MSTTGNNDDRTKITEEERTRMRHRTNARIAHACAFVALIVILVDFAAYVLGRADQFYTTAGVMISIALLAIAALNNPTNFTPKK